MTHPEVMGKSLCRLFRLLKASMAARRRSSSGLKELKALDDSTHVKKTIVQLKRVVHSLLVKLKLL
jgi:hypothetical protein